MKRLMIICLSVLATHSISMADVIHFDEGGYHTINDSTYQNDEIWLDYHIANNPGTHVDLVDGGVVLSLEVFNNASATMSGGSVEDDLIVTTNASITMTGGTVGNGASAFHNANLNMSGGLVGDLTAHSNANITMSGGSVGYSLIAHNSTSVTISGGSVELWLLAYTDGTIYLDGTNFEVGGTPLAYGYKLSDYGILFENGDTDYYTGDVTGILADGSPLDNTFKIFNTGPYYAGTGDIVVIPEPATILLLVLGSVILSKHRPQKK